MLSTPTLLVTMLAALALPAASQDAEADILEAVVGDALHAAPRDAGTELVFEGVTGTMSGCTAQRASVASAAQRSGRVSVRVDGIRADGSPCAAFVAAHVRVYEELIVAAADIAEGDLVDARLRVDRVERTGASRGLVRSALPRQARAARSLPAGTVLRASDVVVGPSVGATLRVVARAGAIRVEQQAQVTTCPSQAGSSPTLVCATLRGGKRVSGFLDADGSLLVQTQGAFGLAEVR